MQANLMYSAIVHTSVHRAPYIPYSESLKSTNLTELCQISLGRRWIRKSNKLTKSKVNPNGTPMYDKLCFGKFCCVKDEETPCGRNSQNIFKVVLNTTKNTHVILGRQWFTTCRFYLLDSVGTRLAVSNDVRTTSEQRIERRQRVSKPRPLDSFAFMFLSFSFHFLSFPFIVLSCDHENMV